MRIKLFLSAILLCFLTSSCWQKEEDLLVKNFPRTIKLSGSPVEKINIISQGNVNLCAVDSFLIIQKKENKIIQIYSTKTHELLAETGLRGRGPGEYMSPMLLKQISHDVTNSSPIVYVYDHERRRFTHINLLSTIQNENFMNKQEILPYVNSYLTNFFYKDDDFFLATPENDSRFVIYDYSTSDYSTTPYLPEVDFAIDKQLLSSVYRSTSCVNKSKGLIVSAPILLGEINYFDLEGKYLRSTIFEPRSELERELSKKNNAKPKHHIVDIELEGSLIYCLNYNNKAGDLSSESKKNNLKIQVFDWDGKPIKEYILDEHRFIRSFTIDMPNKSIYGYCPDDENNTIIKYAIPD